MGHNDFFEYRERHDGHHKRQNYHGDRDYHHSDGEYYQQRDSFGGFNGLPPWNAVLLKLKRNKKIRLIAITGAIVFLILVGSLLYILMPIIIKLIDYISHNGLQSLPDAISDLWNKIWKGSSN